MIGKNATFTSASYCDELIATLLMFENFMYAYIPSFMRRGPDRI